MNFSSNSVKIELKKTKNLHKGGNRLDDNNAITQFKRYIQERNKEKKNLRHAYLKLYPKTDKSLKKYIEIYLFD